MSAYQTLMNERNGAWAAAKEAEAKLARAMGLLGDLNIHLNDDGVFGATIPVDWILRAVEMIREEETR